MLENNLQLINAVQEAINLGHFKLFYEKNNSKEAQQRLRTIYSRTIDPIKTTQNIFENEFDLTISNDEAKKQFQYISSFLKKSAYRKLISKTIKESLLHNQLYKCAICGCDIDIHAHADHIVPFKLVGDELDDNLQMLCTDCNLKKNESLDFQVRFLLKLL